MWVMIAGPYGSGAPTEEARAANLRAMNKVALAVFEAGHVPVIGVNLCLPIIEAAGGREDEIMMPLSLALTERCDACLRLGGASEGADREAARFRAAGKPVYRDLAELPPA